MNKYKLEKSIINLALGTYISNIGNGLFTIAISKLLYDQTGSVLAFGSIIMLENLIVFFMQFISGYVSDVKNPKKVMIMSDLIRGSLLILCGIYLLHYNNSYFVVPIVVSFINIIKPFYRSSNFKLLPSIKRGNLKLINLNSLMGTLFQAGQLTGIASLVPLLYFVDLKVAFIINGLSFILSAILLTLVKLETNVKDSCLNYSLIIRNAISSWKEMLEIFSEDRDFLLHVFASTGDYVSAILINLMLVPMVTIYYANDIYISFFDASFAVGSMLSLFLINAIFKKYSFKNSCWIGLFIQSCCFLILVLFKNPYFTGVIMLAIGLFNGTSVSIFQTSLQSRSDDSIKGRIGSLKNFFVSLNAIIAIPIVSSFFQKSIKYGFLVSFFIMLFYTALTLFLRKSEFFKKLSWI